MSEPPREGPRTEAEVLAERVQRLIGERPQVARRSWPEPRSWMSEMCEWTVKEQSALLVRSNGGLVVRVAKEDHAVFGAEPGARPEPLNPRGVGGWIQITGLASAPDAEIGKWVERGLAFTSTMPHPNEYS